MSDLHVIQLLTEILAELRKMNAANVPVMGDGEAMLTVHPIGGGEPMVLRGAVKQDEPGGHAIQLGDDNMGRGS